MFTSFEGPVEVFFYWPEAVFGDFYWPGAIGSPLASSPVDAIIHNWKNQVFSNETIPGVPQRPSTCLKPPNGGFWNLASSSGVDHFIGD